MPSFLIAAPMSGSGKTTVARGLMALLTQKGYRVQPFKCGPDYIDTKFHEAVCHRPSINLDTFMATPEHVRELFVHYSRSAVSCGSVAAPTAPLASPSAPVTSPSSSPSAPLLSIVEGMMGLFDGYDRDRGSSAEIARVLDLPVVLVVDARSAAYSMAALLSGFLHFREDIRFAGVIYNKVSSPHHEAMLRQVCDDLHIPCLGCLPKAPELEQGSRYLGLDFSEDTDRQPLIKLIGQHINCHQLLHAVTTASSPISSLPIVGNPIVGNASERCADTSGVTLGGVTHYEHGILSPPPCFVETKEHINISRDKLPHWRQQGKTTFITFRLADAMPQSKLRELEQVKAEWMKTHPQPWDDHQKKEYERVVRTKAERWLDQGYGSCLLAQPDIRKIVADALLFHHDKHYWLQHFVIMPNHIHLLVTPIGDNNLNQCIGRVKRFTACAINKELGTTGEVWQRLVFDHLVRNEEQYERFVRYIENNPRNLPADTFTLFSAVINSELVGNGSERCNSWLSPQRSEALPTNSLPTMEECHARRRDPLRRDPLRHDPLRRDPLRHDPLRRDPLRTLVARNAESFCFIYQETLDRLGDVRFFDPEQDVPDFCGIDLLYLPGGYPEKHVEALVRNEACRQAIQAFVEQGGRVVAECGGMMYLCRSIVTDDGEYPQCGVLPYTITARRQDRHLSLGYRRFTLNGQEFRGHEFHYSQFLGEVPPSVTQVYNAKGEPVPTPIFRYKNVLASYTHLYNIQMVNSQW